MQETDSGNDIVIPRVGKLMFDRAEQAALAAEDHDSAVALTPAEVVELELLRGQAEEDAAAALDAGNDCYVDLVQAIADGEDVDAELIEATLDAAGKTVWQFQIDLDALTRSTARAQLSARVGAAKIDRARREHNPHAWSA